MLPRKASLFVFCVCVPSVVTVVDAKTRRCTFGSLFVLRFLFLLFHTHLILWLVSTAAPQSPTVLERHIVQSFINTNAVYFL